MKLKTLAAAASILLAMATGAAAATQTVNGLYELTGATDVEINGILFDVTFSEATCAEAYDGCDELTDFPHATLVGTTQAALALGEQVAIDSVLGPFSDRPWLIAGCRDVGIFTEGCIIVTPFGPLGNSASISTIEIEILPLKALANIRLGSISPDDDFRFDRRRVLAVWSVAPVPLPASGLFLLAGVGGLVAFTRRKKRTA